MGYHSTGAVVKVEITTTKSDFIKEFTRDEDESLAEFFERIREEVESFYEAIS